MGNNGHSALPTGHEPYPNLTAFNLNQEIYGKKEI